MLRSARPLVIIALVFMLAGCGAEATVGTSQSLGGEPTAAPPVAASPSAPPAATVTTAAPSAPASASAAPATATTAPRATATATRSSATATTAAPARTPTVPAAAGGATVVDEDKRCQMALPAGVTEDAPGSGEFTLAGDAGFALLQSVEGAALDTTVSSFVPRFSASFTNYKETDRKKTADSEQIDFTGELVKPVRGTMYFKQFGAVICNVILVAYADAGTPYEPTLAAMLGSLQVVKP